MTDGVACGARKHQRQTFTAGKVSQAASSEWPYQNVPFHNDIVLPRHPASQISNSFFGKRLQPQDDGLKKVDVSLPFSGRIAVICFIAYPITYVRGN